MRGQLETLTKNEADQNISGRPQYGTHRGYRQKDNRRYFGVTGGKRHNTASQSVKTATQNHLARMRSQNIFGFFKMNQLKENEFPHARNDVRENTKQYHR